MLTHFYDIESLTNVFSNCIYKPESDHVEIYYLSDDKFLIDSPTLHADLLKVIHEVVDDFNGTISLHNLETQESNDLYAKTFGLSDSSNVNDPTENSTYPAHFRPVCDTDTNYDANIHPYLFGYNSANYDTTINAMYLHEVYGTRINESGQLVAEFTPTTAALMRSYNDELFLPKFIDSMPHRLTCTYNQATKSWSEPNWQDSRWRIRKSMLRTGRHVDVARLNEKLSKVALKRLLGLLGYQILESDKLSSDTTLRTKEEFYDLIAYNISDVINLCKLFGHNYYSAQFKLKKGLLDAYPDVIYEKKADEYAPDIRPSRVRRDRLTIDSSSAQFATKALCPYGHISDYQAVSYLYPSAEKAAELGIPQKNILEESRKFFYSKFTQPEVRAEFDKIYHFYKNIEGRNFNPSKNYQNDWGGNALKVEKLTDLPKCDTNIHYFDRNGLPTSCFVTFSTGGIHGAEYNKALYEYHVNEYMNKLADLAYVMDKYPEPTDLKKAKTVEMPNGHELKSTQFLTAKSTMKKAEYRTISAPELFPFDKKGSTKLNSKYAYTSVALANHEDFDSYYPNMLIMLSAFANPGLGYDRYLEIYKLKQDYGIRMKDKTKYSAEERNNYSILRNGTKLILNAASGAGDTNFDSSIQVNNKIISMRIIGQLFSWRIGQAQSIEGASIPSTNTDGLYTVLDEKFNAEILEREAADIGVEIEPETMYLISKDSNNRLEIDHKTGDIIAASGGSLSCRERPRPTQSLAHPAAIDWALSEYLIVTAANYKDLAIDKEFDYEVGRNILTTIRDTFEPSHALNMFQNILASSKGSMTYLFGTKPATGEAVVLRHYNRVFLVKDDCEGTVFVQAAVAKAITEATQKKRLKMGERAVQHSELGKSILAANGLNPSAIPDGREAAIKKVTGIEPDWHTLILNNSLYTISDERKKEILNSLDIEKYLNMLADTYENNWRNHLPA